MIILVVAYEVGFTIRSVGREEIVVMFNAITGCSAHMK